MGVRFTTNFEIGPGTFAFGAPLYKEYLQYFYENQIDCDDDKKFDYFRELVVHEEEL